MYLQLEAVSTFVLDFLEKYYRIFILSFKEKVHLFVKIIFLFQIWNAFLSFMSGHISKANIFNADKKVVTV